LDGDLDFVAEQFLGVCETVCIPVQATLEVKPSLETGANSRIVAEAFALLPENDHAGFYARIVEIDDDRLVVETTLPEGSESAELYVASTELHMMGMAERIDGSGTMFSVPYYETGEKGAADQAHYTLVAGDEAVSGTLVLDR
jgi:DsbC/DsbD-like thiol-disulfide interchange protein